MNGLSASDMWCVSISIIIITLYIVVGFYASRKLIGGELPAGDISQTLQRIDFQIRMRGWTTKVHPDKDKITISKDVFIGTNIYLMARSDGKIDILHNPYTGGVVWVIFAAVFLFMLVCGPLGFMALIGAVLLHVMSRNFATREVIPIIVYSHHVPQPLYSMPPAYYTPPFIQPSYVCPTCGRPGRYISAYQRWFCNYCRRYF